MRGADPLRDHGRETQLYRRRALVAGLGALLLVGVLSGRLLYLQYYGYQHYTTLSDDNRLRIEAIAPTRGLIYDRNGTVLAENLPSFRLELIPERVDDLDATLDALRGLVEFDESDVERLRSAWRHARPFEGVPLRFQLTRSEVARVSVQRHRLPGVEIAAGLTRHYPYGRTAVHVLGYVGRISRGDLRELDASKYRASTHVGQTGIEAAYEELLHGEPGFRRVEANVQGRVLRVIEEQDPVPGHDLRLTVDLDFQRLAERLLGDRDGAVVALDPADGGVLALVSAPGFDPNLFTRGIGHADYAALRDSRHRPLFNRALRGQYPPGSTIKPVIALNGLVTGTQHRDETIQCPGYYQLNGTGRRYRDWDEHGRVDLAAAITQSCDVMFYDLALRLGIDELSSFLKRFGFNKPTGIDLPGERPGLVPDPDWKRRARNEPWYTGETLIHGIGQGYMTVTPLQLAAATAVIANRGEPVRPRLFLDSTGARPDGAALQPSVPPIELAHAEDWDYIVDAMVGVTEGERGTARAVGWQSPHTIAGKTGTAQVFSIAEGEEYDAESIAAELRDHALFIAFAPADDPKIAIAVVIENGGSGSSAAAPVARELIDAWLAPGPVTAERDHG